MPKHKILEDQNGRVFWFGDESSNNAEFDSSSLQDGDDMYWVRDGTKTKMGFWVGHGAQKLYYKESDRCYVIKPRWWYTQVRAKPGEKAICVGGQRKKELPVSNLDQELLGMLQVGFSVVTRSIINEEFPSSEEMLLKTSEAFGVLLKTEIPLDSPVRISFLGYLGYLEQTSGVPDFVLPKLNALLLDSLKHGTKLVKEETVRFLAEHDTYFAHPCNSESEVLALRAAAKEVILAMSPELAFDYLEAFGLR